MEQSQEHPVPCPTCGTLCNITWSGLDLVENTGDETLATKNYVPDGGLQEMYDELREDNQRLRAQSLAIGHESIEMRTENNALRNENQRLRDALTEANTELQQLAKDCGGCDHSVGICQCSLDGLIERITELINK